MNQCEQASPVPPRVFISYSHDNAAHCDQVFELAQQLRRDGLKVELDQFHQEELIHWPRWCEEQLRRERSDFVLCVCTPEYRRRVEGRVSADVGKGVFWEGSLIYNYLYDAKGNQRFVPVLLNEALGDLDIPSALQGYTRFKLSVLGLDDTQSEYSKLYRLLTGQSATVLAELGRLQKLSSLPEVARRTDFAEVVASIKRTETNTEGILELLQGGIMPCSSAMRAHTLPLWMSPQYFIGRAEEIVRLCDDLIKSDSEVVQPQVIYGLGGTGKSRLAIQVAWLLYREKRYDLAFFVSAETRSTLDTELAELDSRSLLNLYKDGIPPKELELRKRGVIEALREMAGTWILILDNADSVEMRDAVNQLTTELAGGGFLITTRREDWPRALMRTLHLETFNLAEAVSFFRSRYWKSAPIPEELRDFEDLADHLGNLPLALTLASSYMESQKKSPRQYLHDWQTKNEQLLNFEDRVEYNRSLLAAFKVSYEQLSPSAITLLHRLAWLAPLPFLRSFVESSDVLNIAVSGDISQELAELSVLSLVDLTDKSLSLHKLVLACCRAVMSEETRRDSLASVLEWMSKILPSTEYDQESWSLWAGLGPHLDSVAEASETLNLEGEALANICGMYGVWYYMQAQFRPAEKLVRRALEIDTKYYGPVHPKVAVHVSNLGQLLKDTNRPEEAEVLMRRTLQIDGTTLGPDHQNVSIHLGNLAALFMSTNRFAEAEPLMRRALEIAEKNYGPENPNLSIPLNNLGELLLATNRASEAERLMRRALEIDEKCLPRDHPNVAVRLSNLAGILKDTNRPREAAPLMQRALAIDEKIYGSGHPNVANRLNNLAQLLKATNRVSEAEPLMWRALSIDERSYGPDHPNIAAHLNNLAVLLQTTNRIAEAEPLIRRALDIDERRSGPHHQAVARDLNNLSNLLQATNRFAEAEPLMRRALEIDEHSFGAEHPRVARDLNLLAGLLQATNRLADAEPLIRRACQINEESYGSDHPEVAGSLRNLAALLRATNRLGEAESLIRRALDIDEKSYGPEHPSVATCLNDLTTLLLKTGRVAEAEPLMRRALTIDEGSWGPDHPTVARDLNNLSALLTRTARLSEAERLMRRALDINERSYGADHPDVPKNLNNLAQLLQMTNRPTEAEPLMRRALEIDERVYGLDHPNVARHINSLAALLFATKRFVEAEPLMRRALSIDEKSYGSDHPTVARDLNDLAQLLKAVNRFAEAEALMQRALEIDLKSYGPDHSDIARDVNNLAMLFIATNRLGNAEPLIRRALEIDERNCGPEHPDVAVRLANLAGLLRATNRLAEAKLLFTRSVMIFIKFKNTTGHQHPGFQTTFANFLGLLKQMGLSETEVKRRLSELASMAGAGQQGRNEV
jgi:tetratricopeptide (TPR) repeat protein